jgi:hypothetical protein
MYSSTHSLTSALYGGEWSVSRSGRFTPMEGDSGTHCIGGWVGPRAVLHSVVKRKIHSPCQESETRNPIFQAVAQRYTDWAITANGYHHHHHLAASWQYNYYVCVLPAGFCFVKISMLYVLRLIWPSWFQHRKLYHTFNICSLNLVLEFRCSEQMKASKVWINIKTE